MLYIHILPTNVKLVVWHYKHWQLYLNEKKWIIQRYSTVQSHIKYHILCSVLVAVNEKLKSLFIKIHLTVDNFGHPSIHFFGQLVKKIIFWAPRENMKSLCHLNFFRSMSIYRHFCPIKMSPCWCSCPSFALWCCNLFYNKKLGAMFNYRPQYMKPKLCFFLLFHASFCKHPRT